jgi:hypothetical protein
MHLNCAQYWYLPSSNITIQFCILKLQKCIKDQRKKVGSLVGADEATAGVAHRAATRSTVATTTVGLGAELDVAGQELRSGRRVRATGSGTTRAVVASHQLHLAQDRGLGANRRGDRWVRDVDRLAHITDKDLANGGKGTVVHHPRGKAEASHIKDGGLHRTDVGVKGIHGNLAGITLERGHSLISRDPKKIRRPGKKMEESLQSPGRVFLSAATTREAQSVSSLPGFAYATSAPDNAGMEGVRGNLERTLLNQTFFSAPNFQIIQNGIRKNTFDYTETIIDPVGTDDLFMVMRAIYLQYGRNLPTQIPEQINELNTRVIAYCVPKIVAEVNMYKYYLKDISTLPVQLNQPVNVSSAGTRSLPFNPVFCGC